MDESLRQRLQRHQLVTFFALTYALAFIGFGVYILLPTLPFGPFWLIGIFSPTLAALALVAVLDGRPGIRRLLAGFTRWRIGWRWYLASGVFALGALAIGITYIALGNPPPGPVSGLTVSFLAGQLLYTLVSGPLSEEAGWRGFALPRLQGGTRR